MTDDDMHELRVATELVADLRRRLIGKETSPLDHQAIANAGAFWSGADRERSKKASPANDQ